MIQPFQYEAAYRVGLDRHDGKFGLSEAVGRLKGTGLEKTTASILVGNVSYLLRGQVYKRALSIPTTDDYLVWIRRDRGDVGLRNALRALEKHIAYWEATHRGTRRGLRNLLKKHTAFLDQPKTGAILMEWRDEQSSGYIDVFPLELFGQEGTVIEVVHDVRGPRGGVYEAKANLTVSGRQAEFDFSPYREFNNQNGMMLGVSRIIFEDEDRTKIASVHWKGDKEPRFKEYPFRQPEFEVRPASDYEPDGDFADKKSRMVRERPGQLVFRRTLKSVYSNRCCITGCGVADVLEGAHIDSYRNAASDHVRNGLLLRRDIHVLFDRHLISIDPATHKVHVSSSIHTEEAYAALKGKLLTRPKDNTHHPDKGALERHWKRFRENHTIS